MGRQIKRVALDFEWPRGKTWEGYLNPHYKPCPNAESGQCQGGQTTAGAWLDAICRFIALVGEQALGERNPNAIFPHPYLAEFCNAPSTRGEYDMSSNDVREYRILKRPKVVPPSREFYDLVAALTDRTEPPDSLGMGGMDAYRIRKKLLTLAGIDTDQKYDSWGRCPVCEGEGIDPGCKEAYEAWKPHEPPEGEGWQVWETVSEGSPVSPVCATAEDLIDWLCQPEGTDEKWAKRGFYGTGEPYCYSEQGHTREAAIAFVKGSGWVPSAIREGDGPLVSGIEAAPMMASGKAALDNPDNR